MAETRLIPLTHGKFAIVDAADYDFLMQWKWYAHKHGRRERWYAERGTKTNGKRKTIKMHRFILGLTDPSILVDHKDHNGLNNSRSNIRPCSPSQNIAHAPAPSWPGKSIYRGIAKRTSGKWTAVLVVQQKRIYLGTFARDVDAARAYDAAAAKHFGDFAMLNFPRAAGEEA